MRTGRSILLIDGCRIIDWLRGLENEIGVLGPIPIATLPLPPPLLWVGSKRRSPSVSFFVVRNSDLDLPPLPVGPPPAVMFEYAVVQ